MNLLRFASVSQTSVAGELTPHQRLRRELRIIILAWVFGSLWMWTINGATMTRFAKALNTPDYAFGILAALPFVGTLFQVPAVWFLERFGYRKITFLVLMTVCRILWSVVAIIPWVMPGLDRWWWFTMVALLLVSWSVGNATGPAWISWMGDVIPRRIRGRYFGVRNRIGQIIGVLTTIGVGYLLDRAERAEVVAPGTVLKVTSIMLAVAGVVGVLDIQLFHGVRDDHRPDPANAPQSVYAFLQPFRDRHFRPFLAFTFTINLAVGFMGQYVWLFALYVVGMGNKQANLLIAAFPLVMALISYPLWGRLMDRLGRKPVLVISGVLTILGSLGWVLVGPDAAHDVDWGWAFHELRHSGHLGPLLRGLFGWDWGWRSWIGYMFVLLATFAWSGVDGAAFNIIMDLTDDEPGDDRRAREPKAPGTVYVAINSIAAAVGGMLSGLLAAVVAGQMTNWRWLVPMGGGIILTYHGILFLGSSVLRATAVVLALKIREPRAVGTRQALNYMTSNLYANVRDVVLLPTRLVEQAYRWTARYNPLNSDHDDPDRPE
jgi:MFS family permease